jgi:signal transduction histidine kinase
LQHQRLVSTNDELRQVQGQLVAAERMAAIGEVVTAVAHGIRNPLANIRAAAQVAALDCWAPDNPSAMGRTLANIVTEVDRLEARLKELLQLVRPAERRNEAVDLNTVVRGALELTASRLTEARVVVDEHLAPELGRLLGDAPLLEQGLMGLIENAAQAMEDGGGTLTITTGTAGKGDRRRAFVEVCDTGPGIPASDLGRIFEPFFTTKAQGTGLGLAMARKFVDAHGGFITAGNQPSGGAIFRVMLPIMGEA